MLESILFGVFCSLDLLAFYLLFEAVLIPMFFIVGVYGSRDRKIRASYLLFLYTLISSVFMLVAILALYFWCGTTDYQKLQTVQFDYLMVRFVWIAFFLFTLFSMLFLCILRMGSMKLFYCFLIFWLFPLHLFEFAFFFLCKICKFQNWLFVK